MHDVPDPQIHNTVSQEIACAPNLLAAIKDEQVQSKLDLDQALGKVEARLQKAASKHFGREYDVRMTLHKDGNATTIQVLTVVDHVTDPYRQVLQENAHRHHMKVRVGGEIINYLPTYIPKSLKRFAASAGKFTIKNIQLNRDSSVEPKSRRKSG